MDLACGDEPALFRDRPASVPADCEQRSGDCCASVQSGSIGISRTSAGEMVRSCRSCQSLTDLTSIEADHFGLHDSHGHFSTSRKWSSSSSQINDIDDTETRLLPMKLTPRLKELKREASVRANVALDYASEKLMRDASQLTSSWSSFYLDERSTSPSLSTDSGKLRSRANSLSEPVHILTNNYPSSCSPSPPTRQCYSPSMQQVVRNNAIFSESPSRNSVMRSLSPIAMQTVKYKRKSFEENSASLCKRRRRVGPSELSPFSSSSSSAIVDQTSRLRHSLSNSSLDSAESGCSGSGMDLRKTVYADQMSEPDPSSEEQSDVNSSNVNSPVMVGCCSDMQIVDSTNTYMA